MDEIAIAREEKRKLNKAIKNLSLHIAKANEKNQHLSSDLSKHNNEITTLRENNTELQEHYNKILHELVNVKKLLCNSETEVIATKENYLKLIKENQQQHEEHEELNNAVKKLIGNLDVANREIAIKNDEIQNLSDKYDSCVENLDNANRQIAIKNDEMRNLSDKYEDCFKKLTKQQTKNEDLSALRNENEELKKTNDNFYQCLSSNRQLREENRNITEKNENLRKELANLALAAEEDKKHVASLETNLNAANGKIVELTDICSKSSEEILMISKEKEILNKQYSVLKIQLDTFVSDIDNLSTSLNDSVNEVDQLKAYNETLLLSNLEKLGIIVRLTDKIRNGNAR